MRFLRAKSPCRTDSAKTRWFGLAVSVIYIAAAVGSSALHIHSHDHGDCCPDSALSEALPAAPQAGCSHHHCSHSKSAHKHDSSHSHPDHKTPRPAPLHDDDCSACQFVAKKQLTPQVVTVTGLTVRVTEVVPVDDSTPPHRAPHTHRSRGPPVV